MEMEKQGNAVDVQHLIEECELHVMFTFLLQENAKLSLKKTMQMPKYKINFNNFLTKKKEFHRL